MINPYMATEPSDLAAEKQDLNHKINPKSRWWWFAILGAIAPSFAWVVCIGFLNYAPFFGINETTYNLLLGIPGLIIAIIMAVFTFNFGYSRTAASIAVFWLLIALLQVWITLAFQGV